ncbi:MAG TPA: 2-amino-4-hydroxy-6-hydroxymethyldihydropteridine diphosphokinase [Verrucomicrobiae bacterium]|nr:2-amino-4-hydroxy-6-hydroxymethyldihydropteridine diphosphokinase [Verrucomicrobiae bacterium]
MKIGLGLGSNLGDRLRHLQQAKAYLLSLSREAWHIASPLYETEPVGCPPHSPRFLNAVLEVEYEGAPKTLLKKILAYEVAHGRDRDLPKNAARTIDIDILYFGEKEILEKDLEVPHPRMAERRFVLLPLSTIRPDLIVKGTGKTVRTLLRELPTREGEVKFVQNEW